jgi:hypothetical protein
VTSGHRRRVGRRCRRATPTEQAATVKVYVALFVRWRESPDVEHVFPPGPPDGVGGDGVPQGLGAPRHRDRAVPGRSAGPGSIRAAARPPGWFSPAATIVRERRAAAGRLTASALSYDLPAGEQGQAVAPRPRLSPGGSWHLACPAVEPQATTVPFDLRPGGRPMIRPQRPPPSILAARRRTVPGAPRRTSPSRPLRDRGVAAPDVRNRPVRTPELNRGVTCPGRG